jgi:hypothetical protein
MARAKKFSLLAFLLCTRIIYWYESMVELAGHDGYALLTGLSGFFIQDPGTGIIWPAQQ